MGEKKKQASAYREPLILIAFVILGAIHRNGDGRKSVIPVSNWPDLVEPAVCTAGSAAFLLNFQFYR